jgi:hypothetical protein
MTNDQITDALKQLRTSVDVPPIDAAREQSLLSAFDAHWATPPAASHGWVWRSAAVLAAVSIGLNWLVLSQAPGSDPAATEPETDLTGFVSLPGAESFPTFESGSLVRVNLPATSLPALGLGLPAENASEVLADIVVGQDGLARAVRLVKR